MHRSQTTNVVFFVHPESEHLKMYADLIDVNGSTDAGWVSDHLQTGGELLEELFGDEIPARVRQGGKFMARGHLEAWRSGYPGEEEWNQNFELESWVDLTDPWDRITPPPAARS